MPTQRTITNLPLETYSLPTAPARSGNTAVFTGPTELSDAELAQVVGGPAPYFHPMLFEGRFCYLGGDTRYSSTPCWH